MKKDFSICFTLLKVLLLMCKALLEISDSDKYIRFQATCIDKV